jgi:hypothetical protein
VCKKCRVHLPKAGRQFALNPTGAIPNLTDNFKNERSKLL